MAGREPMPALLGFARDNLGAEIRAAIADGADPNAANAFKQTALHIATLHGNLEAIAALLECGADPNAANERGMRPLARSWRLCEWRFPALGTDALRAVALRGVCQEGQRASGVRAAAEARRGPEGACWPPQVLSVLFRNACAAPERARARQSGPARGDAARAADAPGAAVPHAAASAARHRCVLKALTVHWPRVRARLTRSCLRAG